MNYNKLLKMSLKVIFEKVIFECVHCYQEHVSIQCIHCDTEILDDKNFENILDCKGNQLTYVQIYKIKEYIDEVKEEIDRLREENCHLRYRPGGEGAREAQKHFKTLTFIQEPRTEECIKECGNVLPCTCSGEPECY